MRLRIDMERIQYSPAFAAKQEKPRRREEGEPVDLSKPPPWREKGIVEQAEAELQQQHQDDITRRRFLQLPKRVAPKAWAFATGGVFVTLAIGAGATYVALRPNDQAPDHLHLIVHDTRYPSAPPEVVPAGRGFRNSPDNMEIMAFLAGNQPQSLRLGSPGPYQRVDLRTKDGKKLTPSLTYAYELHPTHLLHIKTTLAQKKGAPIHQQPADLTAAARLNNTQLEAHLLQPVLFKAMAAVAQDYTHADILGPQRNAYCTAVRQKANERLLADWGITLNKIELDSQQGRAGAFHNSQRSVSSAGAK